MIWRRRKRPPQMALEVGAVLLDAHGREYRLVRYTSGPEGNSVEFVHEVAPPMNLHRLFMEGL